MTDEERWNLNIKIHKTRAELNAHILACYVNKDTHKATEYAFTIISLLDQLQDEFDAVA